MSQKYNISERTMREAVGAGYKLENYVEGRDYVRHKIRVGTRVAFRSDMLSSMEPKVAVMESKDHMMPLEQNSETIVSEVVVTRRHPNQRYVETTGGLIFVGGKPVKVGQKLKVRDQKLVLK